MPKVKVRCENCGCITEKWPSQLRRAKHVYCSPGCQQEARRKRIQVVCETCGKTFERVPSQIKEDGNYCSPACAYEARCLDLGEAPLCACGCGQQVTGKRRGQWCLYLHGHSFRGKHHTEETRKELSKIGLQMSHERAERIRGDKNPVWRGGGRHQDYDHEKQASGFNWWQRQKTRERLITERGHQCETCDATTKPLELHHIDHDISHNKDDNLILVCRSCQMKATAEFVKVEHRA